MENPLAWCHLGEAGATVPSTRREASRCLVPKARLCAPGPRRPWSNPKAHPITEQGKEDEAAEEGEEARLHSQFYAPMMAIG